MGDEPSLGTGTRSVTGIIYSCSITVFACTWIAIHPNIPSPNDTWKQRILRRFGILVAGLLAPEFIVTWAIRQWLATRVIMKEVKINGGHICRTHAFFILMGGYMLTDSSNEPLLPLTYDEIIKLSEDGLISFAQTNMADIVDKSKGDPLSKVIALLQTTWFVVQMISRLVGKLSITPLEISTLGFAILNIVTYCFWWYKPLNIDSPIRIQLFEPHLYSATHKLHPPLRGPAWNHYIQKSLKRMRQFLQRFLTSEGRLGDQEFQFEYRKTYKRVPTFFSGPIQPLRDSFYLLDTQTSPQSDCPVNLALRRYRNWIVITTLIQTVTAIVFGALHLLGWLWAFPIPIESWWWRTCSLTIVILPITILISFTSFFLTQRWAIITLRNFRLLCLIIYVIARISLIVLCFTSLRNLPTRAKIDVDWTRLIPHI